MGNCIYLLCSAAQDAIKVLVFNGEREDQFMASTTVEQVTSGPYKGYSLVQHAQPHSPQPDTQLASDEVYNLVPSLVAPCSPPSLQLMASKAGCGKQIRVTLTRNQLEDLLMKGGDGFSSEKLALWVIERCGLQQRWKPTLTTIPELLDC